MKNQRADAKRLGIRILVAPLSVTALIVLTQLAPISTAQSEGDAEPDVPFRLSLGSTKFEKFCAECHGTWAGGTDRGPPLLHVYYVKSHHGDSAFYRAIFQGSPQHHWTFGDMKPVEGVTREDAGQIIEYVRWLQAEKGIN